MKKRISISLFVVMVLALAGAGVYQFRSRQHAGTGGLGSFLDGQPSQNAMDEVFRKYLIKTAQIKSAGSSDSFSGTGTTFTGGGIYDVTGKRLLTSGELACNAHVDGNAVTLKATMQSEGNQQYLRLNEITGTVLSDDGSVLYLSDVYGKAVGAWYKLPDPIAAVQEQLDAGILASDGGVYAPGYDAEKVATAFIGNRVFDYSSNKVEQNYVFHVTANPLNYTDALKTAFPAYNNNNQEEITRFVFKNTGNSDTTLTVRADGTLVKQDDSMQNPCVTLVQTFAGVAADDLPKTLLGTSTPKAADSVHIEPVGKDAKPLNELTKDLSL